jgi:hypothetical protein
MHVPPPPKPRGNRRSAQFIVLIIVAVLGGVLGIRAVVIASGITKWPDSQFGDQHLKTTD